jgi:hypothetical protein
MTYVPPQPVMSRDDWPTLGEMIESGKRVVVFMDKGAEARTEPAVDFILPQFQMVRLVFSPSWCLGSLVSRLSIYQLQL